MGEIVVREVQHGRVRGEGGEGGEALHAAVDKHSVGGGHVQARGEVVEGAKALAWTGGVYAACVILHYLE